LNIVLIGYRCSGKTVVGKLLADELARTFVDTDEAIEENTGVSIAAMVDRKGWDYFRDVERAFIRSLSTRDNLVIATGGGVILDRENMKNLKENGWIVWLQGQPGVLKARMAKDMESGRLRPSLSGTDPLEEVDSVLQVRSGLYAQAGDYVVHTDHQPPEAVAGMIIKAFGLLGGD
jgi:shikimate kinase